MSQECHSALRVPRGLAPAQIATLAYEFTSGHVIPEHFHPEDQLVFASKGVMTVLTTQGIWVVPTLRAVWIPATVPHSIEMSGAVSMRTLYFRPKLVRGFGRRCVVINVMPLLRELIIHACKFARLQKGIAAERRIVEVILDQLQAADAMELQLPSPRDPRLERVVRRLLADPGTRASLDELCQRCGASKRTIQRTFLADTNLSFTKWRRQLRLLCALRLLASGTKVTAVALEAGYDSTSAFISMFRKQLGTTPLRYFEADRTS